MSDLGTGIPGQCNVPDERPDSERPDNAPRGLCGSYPGHDGPHTWER